jgi:hypothetical protein
MRRRARRGTQLLDDLWGTGFGRGYGIVVGQTAE